MRDSDRFGEKRSGPATLKKSTSRDYGNNLRRKLDDMLNEIGNSHGTGHVPRSREEQFRVLTGGIDHLVFSTDTYGNFTYISPEVEMILGYSPAELSGRNVAALVSPPDRNVLDKRLAGELMSSSPLDVRLVHKDGSSIPARSVLWTMGNTGKIGDAFGMVSDSGGLDRYRVQDRRDSNITKMIIEMSGDAVFLLDESARIIEWNSAMERATGISRELAIGKPGTEIAGTVFPGKDPASAPQVSGPGLRQLLETGAIEKMNSGVEITIVRPDGAHFVLEFMPVFIPAENGTMRGGILRDITERKRREEGLIAANKKINLLNSITRHDINNQLTVFTGYLALMEDKKCPVPSIQVAKILQGANGKIQRIIRFSKEYQDIGVQTPAWQNLWGVITQARMVIEAKNLKTTVDPGCREVAVFADPMLIKVFYNLIDNTLRHGEKTTEITFSCNRENQGLKIIYEDNGVGIADEYRQFLFQRGKGKNTGYGLFLIREILSISDFEIEEKGEKGKGVRFEILIPPGSWKPVEPGTSPYDSP
jgi:PAS domain S-box-containing protein